MLHSDELPGYGITPETVNELRTAMGLTEGDAFAVCADDQVKAGAGLCVAAQNGPDGVGRSSEGTRGPATRRAAAPLQTIARSGQDVPGDIQWETYPCDP